MRRIFALIFFIALCTAATPAHAQRDTIAPPVGGVYQAYYEEEANNLLFYLVNKNICLERFATLNPHIQLGEPIPYGTVITLPRNEKCYVPKYSYNNHYNGLARLKYYEANQWLDEPYYSSDARFIGMENKESISSYQQIAQSYFNACLDDLLSENYLWQYYTIEQQTHPTYPREITLDVFVPYGLEPCDPNWVSPWSLPNYHRLDIRRGDLTPDFLIEEYGICPESINGAIGWDLTGLSLNNPDDMLTLYWLEATPSCYNEMGQRLIYFDVEGQRLPQPHYTDLEVYRASPFSTPEEIAREKGVCVNDLLRLNNFPDMPLVFEIELVIPLPRPCETDVVATLITPNILFDYRFTNNLLDLALSLNICSEVLTSLNPHLLSNDTGHVRKRAYANYSTLWVLMPANPIKCYTTYHTNQRITKYDLEQIINICHEALFQAADDAYATNVMQPTTLYYRVDEPPCYDAQGQRLQYSTVFDTIRLTPSPLDYSPLRVHIFQPGEYLIDISRQYNVCVHDILNMNPILNTARIRNYPLFLPETRPCYDTKTQLQISYDSTTEIPYITEKLIHYGAQTFTRISYYYNVCTTQIASANQQKLEGKVFYIGWIILADRPPCYDAGGSGIRYLCYAQNEYGTRCFEDYSANTHTVHFITKGETLFSIAELYDLEIGEVVGSNLLDVQTPLWSGYALVIPKESTSTRFYALVLGSGVIALLFFGLILPLARRKNQAR